MLAAWHLLYPLPISLTFYPHDSLLGVDFQPFTYLSLIPYRNPFRLVPSNETMKWCTPHVLKFPNILQREKRKNLHLGYASRLYNHYMSLENFEKSLRQKNAYLELFMKEVEGQPVEVAERKIWAQYHETLDLSEEQAGSLRLTILEKLKQVRSLYAKHYYKIASYYSKMGQKAPNSERKVYFYKTSVMYKEAAIHKLDNHPAPAEYLRLSQLYHNIACFTSDFTEKEENFQKATFYFEKFLEKHGNKATVEQYNFCEKAYSLAAENFQDPSETQAMLSRIEEVRRKKEILFPASHFSGYKV